MITTVATKKLNSGEYNYEQYMKLLETPNNEAIMQSILILNFSHRKLTQLPDSLPPKLQKLVCDHNQLRSLPDSLPPALQTLHCYNNQLIKLPDSLPPTLLHLYCYHNQLICIPDLLPPTLQQLYCDHNQLSKLPDSLPPTLQTLYCQNNQLLKLPDSLSPTLLRLDCGNNQLHSLPDLLPPTLQKLYCNNNQLSKLPDSLPPKLQTLSCYYNQLRSLPDSLPPKLQELNCGNNRLISIPDSLPPTLQELNCHHNQLICIPDSLPPTLQNLNCYNNQLVTLPDTLPLTLQNLDCENNQLTTLPLSIIHTQCDYSYLQYSNNPIEYLPVQIVRWLNHVKTSQRVYQDTQSVHNHSIQQGIQDAVTWLTRSKPTVELSQVMEAIVCKASIEASPSPSFQFQPKSKQFQLTFAELLVAVWSHILTYSLDVRNEIWKVMDTEMQDAECKCFTGRMSRLVNCLNGFDDQIKIQISANEQIGNIITVERNRLALSNPNMTEVELVALLKTNVALALRERAYSDTMIQEWIAYIE
jgi:Leucine-rich repeat (LRR) protein